jgi:hypothetical protein
MRNKNWKTKLEKMKNLPDVFEMVKEIVERSMGLHRAGLMLVKADLGIKSEGFIGAYFKEGTNAIVVNRQVFDAVKRHHPEKYKSFIFYVLLHEYIHSLGYHDESECRGLALEISERSFGRNHMVSLLARDMYQVIGRSLTPMYKDIAPEDESLELEPGFDRSSTVYIQ